MYSCPGAACTVSVMYVWGGGGGGGRLTVYSCPGAACTVSVMYVWEGEGRGEGGRLTVYSCPGAACTVSVMYVWEGEGRGEGGGGGDLQCVAVLELLVLCLYFVFLPLLLQRHLVHQSLHRDQLLTQHKYVIRSWPENTAKISTLKHVQLKPFLENIPKMIRTF